ncbi:hypothetical protein ACHAWF_016588 [Thalassiosira exigua]
MCVLYPKHYFAALSYVISLLIPYFSHIHCSFEKSTECPFDDHCFSLTPCTEELGYPEEDDLVDGGNTGAAVSGGGGQGSEGGEACVPILIVIVADHWPKETSWKIINTAFGDPEHSVIAEGNNKDLAPGEPVDWLECVNNKNGCYEFTIYDSGGDGVCCEHGDGSYTISYENKVLKEGGAFYDFESTPFGYCGNPPTEEPTESPKEYVPNDAGAAGNSGGSSYRCVMTELVESGYVISKDKCGLFTDCFNKHINIGDDWYCDDNARCVEAPTCGTGGDVQLVKATAAPVQLVKATTAPVSTSSPTKRPTQTSVSRPIVSRPKPTTDASSFVAKSPPTPIPTEADPPTMLPTTFRPTFGPCDGDPCLQEDHCRSQYGFCGPGETYCRDGSIWSKDCPSAETSEPSPSPTSKSPTVLPVTSPETPMPSISVPASLYTNPPLPDPTMQPSPKTLGYQKPLGGKGPPSKPSKPMRTNNPTPEPTNRPTNEVVTTREPTFNPSSAPVVVLDSPKTAIPTRRPSQPPSSQPSKRPTHQPTGDASKSSPNSRVPTVEAHDNNPTHGAHPVADTSEEEMPGEASFESNNTPSSALGNSAALAYDPGCSGEPCPVDSHCRSRYGSCGPGFIYCNIYSIWKGTCPPVTWPTRNPTAKPTESPEISTEDSSTTSPWLAQKSKRPSLNLPALAKPTLLTITKEEAMPFVPPSRFPDSGESFTESDEEKINDDGSSNDDDEEPSTGKPPEPNESEYFQSPEYLNDWRAKRDAENAALSMFKVTRLLARCATITHMIMLIFILE